MEYLMEEDPWKDYDWDGKKTWEGTPSCCWK